MLVLAAVAGMAVPVDADKKTSGSPTAELTAYTTLPAETAAILSEVYERENKVRVNFVPMSSQEILQEIKNDAVSDPTVVRTVDIVVADSNAAHFRDERRGQRNFQRRIRPLDGHLVRPDNFLREQRLFEDDG